MAEPVIVTEALSKRYGPTLAVDRLDLEVGRGEVFGLLGPNGAGKTTTVLMLLGLSPPSSGRARVVGLDPTREPLAVKRRVGYLPDSVGFYERLTGRENLRYVARLNGLSEDEADARIDRSLEQVGLVWAADDRAGTYSRGMLQRLGIADALIKDPEVLVLDEPTIAIDPSGVNEILSLIERLRDEHGVTVLLSSHLLHQVQRVCDRVAIFVRGKVVASGTIAELARTLTEGRQRVEIGVTGDPDGAVRTLAAIEGVESVERVDDLLVVTSTHDVRGAIVDRLRDGRTVTHLHRRDSELDEIYQRYFDQPDGERS